MLNFHQYVQVFMKVKKYLMLLFLFCSLSVFVYGSIGINVNLIGYGRWRLEGIYNNGYCFTSKPVSPSVYLEKKLGGRIGLVLDYQYLPVSITSPDCYQYNYNGTQFWFRQRLSFTDNRIKLGFVFSIFCNPKLGEVTLGVYSGTSLTTLIKEGLTIEMEDAPSRVNPSSTGSAPLLLSSQKEFFRFGYTSLFSTSLSWMIPLNRKLDLMVAFKYDYVDYQEETSYPNKYSSKEFLIRYNQTLAASLGIVYRGKR